MFRRPVVVRRRGSPLLRTAVVGGAAYMAGKGAERGATRESSQEQRLNTLEQQQGMPQQGYEGTSQQMYQQPPPSQQGYQQMPPQQAEQASQAAPAAHVTTDDKLTRLKTLGELRQSSVLTEAEFEAEKQKILLS